MRFMPSSYSEEDVTILLKDISGQVEPLATRQREKLIQSGIHYCEMLPLEYQPSEKYIKQYEYALERFSGIKTRLGNSRTVDVIGTEEFMFPAVLLAKKLEENGFKATSHSTTRSPIVPSDSQGYPLNSRCRLHSLYDYERTTFLYNLYECDAVILITDAETEGNAALNELVEFLKASEIIIVSWRK